MFRGGLAVGVACGFLLFAGCRQEPADPTPLESSQSCPDPGLIDDPQPVTQFVAEPEDFDCFLEADNVDRDPHTRWYQVRRFYLRNLAGRTQEALDVACGRQAGDFPPGTIVQLIFFEAMAKRGGGFGPESNGWEFFALDVQEGQTEITDRGVTQVTNFAGGNCYDCHSKAEPEYDFICEQGHGCDPLNVDPELLEQFRRGDPRCSS